MTRAAKAHRSPPRWRIQHADCLKALPKLRADSVDAIVTDPPYGLGFMGKAWDAPGGTGAYPMRRTTQTNTVNTGVGRQGGRQRSCRDFAVRQARDARNFQAWNEAWAREALRVLKPGAHLLAFGGTRTFHRLTCALEDAGFEIRDCLCWLYGSGFPKSLNVAVAIDKAQGRPPRGRAIPVAATHLPNGRYAKRKLTANPVEAYQARGSAAAAWQGWGTALKPAWEPIIVARKPLDGTVAQNALRHETGALNIDGCRIGFRCLADERASKAKNRHADFRSKARKNRVYGRDERACGNYDAPGRWPANLVLAHTVDCRQVGHTRIRSNGHHPAARGAGGLGTAGHSGQEGLVERGSAGEFVGCWECAPDCAVRTLDEHSGEVGNGWTRDYGERYAREGRQYEGGCFGGGGFTGGSTYVDTGGASRFFYCAKASRSERNAGLGGFDATTNDDGRQQPLDNPYLRGKTPRQNVHPTVKPLALMRWLVRLVTPAGGTVLDPFAGSGTTGIAAVIEGARFLGIEREAEYAAIARARIRHWAPRTTAPGPTPKHARRSER